MMSGFKQIVQTSRFKDGANGDIVPQPVLARPNLAELLAQVTPENLPDDADVCWGKPQSTEE